MLITTKRYHSEGRSSTRSSSCWEILSIRMRMLLLIAFGLCIVHHRIVVTSFAFSNEKTLLLSSPVVAVVRQMYKDSAFIATTSPTLTRHHFAGTTGSSTLHTRPEGHSAFARHQKQWCLPNGKSPYHSMALFMTSSSSSYQSRQHQSKRSSSQSSDRNSENSFLLDEFRTASGELINPYTILKVSRTASKEQIRSSYIALSKRYHPDTVRYRSILPGSCNNQQEVRDHWERINLSYRILSHKTSRSKYDRHEALANPGDAFKRAVAQSAFDGIHSLGTGIWSVGTFAIKTMIDHGNNHRTKGKNDNVEKGNTLFNNNNNDVLNPTTSTTIDFVAATAASASTPTTATIATSTTTESSASLGTS
jgi:DnaJ domain